MEYEPGQVEAPADDAWFKAQDVRQFSRGQLIRFGGLPFKVKGVNDPRPGYVRFRALNRFELWALSHPRLYHAILPALYTLAVLAVALAVSGCRYEQRPVEAGGNLECAHDGANICGGKFHLSGSCVDLIDLNGQWKLCKSTEPAQVWCTLTSTMGVE